MLFSDFYSRAVPSGFSGTAFFNTSYLCNPGCSDCTMSGGTSPPYSQPGTTIQDGMTITCSTQVTGNNACGDYHNARFNYVVQSTDQGGNYGVLRLTNPGGQQFQGAGLFLTVGTVLNVSLNAQGAYPSNPGKYVLELLLQPPGSNGPASVQTWNVTLAQDSSLPSGSCNVGSTPAPAPAASPGVGVVPTGPIAKPPVTLSPYAAPPTLTVALPPLPTAALSPPTPPPPSGVFLKPPRDAHIMPTPPVPTMPVVPVQVPVQAPTPVFIWPPEVVSLFALFGIRL